MRILLQDVRYGCRMLLKSPGFTIIAVVALGLGIGANTAIFSVVNGVLLRPLPFAEPDRIMGLRETLPDEGSIPLAYRTFAEWRDRNTVFENVAAMTDWNVNLESGDEPVRLSGLSVSASYFAVMGLRPVLGRAFLPEEERPGGEKVVVLGYDLWQGRFGGAPDIIGQSVRLNGLAYHVVGVMPPALGSRDIGWMDIWTPLAIDDQKARLNYGRYLSANARLKPGVSVEQAGAELEQIMNLLKRDFETTHGKEYGVDIRPLKNFVVAERTQTALLILLGAVGCVLLIACANVANLLLAQASAREREMAIRAAIGASRWRLVRQLLIESVLLALLGAGLGLLLAAWGTDLLLALNPEALPRLPEVRINGPVLGFTLALTLLTGMLFGLAPALGATNINLNEMLKEGARTGGAGLRRNRLRGLLVISQTALAFILLVGAGLLMKSFLRLRAVEPGFEPDNLLTLEVTLPWRSYPEPHQRVNFYRQTLERIRALPGVAAASATQSLPLRPTYLTDALLIEGRAVAPRGQEPSIRGTAVTSEYFRTLKAPLVRGRHFSEQETWETGGAVIVNEAFARRFFPNEDPIGKRVKAGFDTPWITIVGVAGNTIQDDFSNPIVEEMFYPYVNTTDSPVVRMNLVIRTTVAPANLAGAVRGEIRGIDRNLPASHVLTMRELADKSMMQSRVNLLLLGVFAAVALVLATIGIYGVISYVTVRRTREIGIRLALGGQARDVLSLVVRQGMTLAVIGVGVGLAGALVVTRALGSLLYGVSATDPVVFTGITLLLTAVAFMASYIPARRATKVDPIEALRYE